MIVTIDPSKEAVEFPVGARIQYVNPFFPQMQPIDSIWEITDRKVYKEAVCVYLYMNKVSPVTGKVFAHRNDTFFIVDMRDLRKEIEQGRVKFIQLEEVDQIG